MSRRIDLSYVFPSSVQKYVIRSSYDKAEYSQGRGGVHRDARHSRLSLDVSLRKKSLCLLIVESSLESFMRSFKVVAKHGRHLVAGCDPDLNPTRFDVTLSSRRQIARRNAIRKFSFTFCVGNSKISEIPLLVSPLWLL